MPGTVQNTIRDYQIKTELKNAGSHVYNSSWLQKRDKQFGEEVRAYWKQHLGIEVNPAWHYIYANATGNQDVQYVSIHEWFSHIHDSLNEPLFVYPTFGDKNFLDLILDKAHFPETVFKRINGNYYDENNLPISEMDAVDRLSQSHQDMIAKPSMSSHGDRIQLVQNRDGSLFVNNSPGDYFGLSRLLGQNFIVQNKVEQHPDLAEAHPDSLNTIRLYTVRLNGQIHPLLAVIRIGAEGKIADNHMGGVICSIKEDGAVSSVAYNRRLQPFYTHPTTGIDFKSIKKIPAFGEVNSLCISLHEQVPHLDFAAWDVAVDKFEKPVIIEINSKPDVGAFQIICRKNLFGSLTEEILHGVRDKQKYRQGR